MECGKTGKSLGIESRSLAWAASALTTNSELQPPTTTSPPTFHLSTVSVVLLYSSLTPNSHQCVPYVFNILLLNLLEIKNHQYGSSLEGELFPVNTGRCSDGTHWWLLGKPHLLLIGLCLFSCRPPGVTDYLAPRKFGSPNNFLENSHCQDNFGIPTFSEKIHYVMQWWSLAIF